MKRAGLVLLWVMAACAVGEAQTTIYWAKDHIYAGPGGGEIATVTPAPSDTTAPTAPSGLAYTALTYTYVDLSSTGSTDSGGSSLAGYKIYRQRASGANLPVGTVAAGTTTFRDQPLTAGISFTYTIVAFDNAQNHSSASGSISVTSSSDTTAPSVPADPTVSYNSATSVQVSWSASTDSVP